MNFRGETEALIKKRNFMKTRSYRMDIMIIVHNRYGLYIVLLENNFKLDKSYLKRV